MRKQRQIKGKFNQRITKKFPINYHQTIFLATDVQTQQQQYIVKSIFLGQQFAGLRKMQETVIKKLYGSSQPMIKKPQQYCFDEQSQTLYLVDKVLLLSLESIIQFHKYRKGQGKGIKNKQSSYHMNPSFVFNFACKIYEMLNRIKNSGDSFYHKNLKPSNIFMNIVGGQIEWKITQFGILTRYPNKYYRSLRNISLGMNNVSSMSQDYETDLYALGVILLQMITLAPLDKLYKNLHEDRSIDSIEQIKQAQNYFGGELISFIKQLLRPTQNIKKAFGQFKDNPPQFSQIQSYKQLQWTYEKFEQVIKQNIYQMVIDKLRKQTTDNGIRAEDVLATAEKYDPDLDFQFQQFRVIQNFFREFYIDLKQSQIFQFGFIMKCCSGVNYMEIVKQIFSAKDIVEGVVKKAIQKYNTRKQFFEAQTGSRQFWKSEDVSRFLQTLGVYLNDGEITEIVKGWTGDNKRTSLKYDEFNKIFKGVGRDVQASKSNTKQTRTQQNQKTLEDILMELKNKLQGEKNLVNFFRFYDKNQKWIVGPEIEKEIQKKVSVSEKQFRIICQQLWDDFGITSGDKKILPYIQVLKLKKIYDLTELFKIILVQKMNELGMKKLYRQYQKDERGWTFNSIIDFNEHEQLDFEERQLKNIFGELDKDKSGYLDEKQLLYRLTGLKQFDIDFIINKVKAQLKESYDLFEVCIKFDVNKDLVFDAPGDIAKVFQFLQITDVPTQHIHQLFINGMRKDKKYPYLEFLRHFVKLQTLFVKSCIVFIDYFYNGNFQKFYDMGRIQNKQKWSRASFSKVNQEFLLGFTQKQVGQIWQAYSKDQDAMTKQQISKIFNYSYRPDENILGLSTGENFYKQNSQMSKKNENKIIQKQKESKPQSRNQNKQKNQLIMQIIQKNQADAAMCFAKKSRQSGSLSFNQFCECLDSLQIRIPKTAIMRNTSQFQFMDKKSNLMNINYIQLIMYACQIQQKEKEKRKAQCLSIILKQLMNFQGLTTEKVFEKTKKPNAMRLTQYQNFVRDLVKTEIYFDDIEDTWNYWGNPDYLTPEDFNQITSHTKSNKSQRQYSFGQNQRNSRNNARQQSVQSPYFARNSQSRNQKYGGRSRDQSKLSSQKDRDRSEKVSSTNQVQKKNKQQIKLFDNQRNTIISKNNVEIDEKKEKKQREKEKEKQKQKVKQISESQVLQKFQQKLKQKGSNYLNNLFIKNNVTSTQNFATCLQQNYDMLKHESEKLCQIMSSFGRVKIETIKKFMKRDSSLSPQQKKKVSRQKIEIKQPTMVNKTAKNITNSDKRKQQIDEKLMLQDPRKQKLNIPLIKDHIKILLSNFTKRFDLHQLQNYFFEGNTQINKQQFIKKCRQINSSISNSMYQKIFEYLKPKAGFVSSVAFKLVFSFDQDIYIEEPYLPEEVQQQIKTIFEKSDKDKSGYIDVQEVQILLGTLGLNQTQKQIQNYFSKIDKNFDKKISLPQFKMFMEQNILPLIGDYQEQVDALIDLLNMNDVFRTGFLPVVTIGAILQRYGVKLNEKQITILNRYMANESNQISIKQFLNTLEFPGQKDIPNALKSILYRIRWRKKVSLKDIQKIFQNISASFVISYTNGLIKKKLLTPSTFITPILNESRFFYNDFNYKNFYNLDKKQPNLVNDLKQTDLVVEIKLVDVVGIPIPQNQSVKNSILNRLMNITFFDASIEQAKDCLTPIKIQFDQDVQDQWIFDKNNRSVFIKISNYQPRKFDKVLLLFQFVMSVSDGQKIVDISCGTVSFPVRQLTVDAKVTRKYKIISGLPNKSKQIDKMSVSKRKGWRGLIGFDNVQSELQIQIWPSNKILDKIPYICTLPQKSIVNRKALHLMWTFRQYFAFKSADQKRANPDFIKHFIVQTFLQCLNIPDIYQDLYLFWKDKIQPKVGLNAELGRKIFQPLMMDLYIVTNSKQFEILPSYPSKTTYKNKNLQSIRKKLLQQVFANIQQWVTNNITREYQRRKFYAVQSLPFKISQQQFAPQNKLLSQKLIRIK